MPDCRFIIDESGFNVAGLEVDALVQTFDEFAEHLLQIRSQGQSVAIISSWAWVPALEDEEIGTFLTSLRLPRDLQDLVSSLLDKCESWDASNTIAVEPEVVVDGVTTQSYGVAFVYSEAQAHHAKAVVTLSHSGRKGFLVVSGANGQPKEVFFVQDIEDHKHFFRRIYEVENITEADFFSFAQDAFPRLRFAPNLSFNRFVGTYHALRDEVVRHLGLLNDDFLTCYRMERGRSGPISTRLGIDVSIEGNTRASERLMNMRLVDYEGDSYLCEWHSKLEPHRNRIHFSVIPSDLLLIGIFVDHLPT